VAALRAWIPAARTASAKNPMLSEKPISFALNFADTYYALAATP
jgi:hypothetical protein